VKAESRQPLAQRTTTTQQARPIAPVPRHAKVNIYSTTDASTPLDSDDEEDTRSEMDLDEGKHLDTGLTPSLGMSMDMGMGMGMTHEDGSSLGDLSDDEEDDEEDDDNWLRMSEEDTARAEEELAFVKGSFQDDVDMFDTTMVAEYADEIFGHMGFLEVSVVCLVRFLTMNRTASCRIRGTWISRLR